ncbi:hypothetical protein D3870_02675 [Noviherbaspirillum cavernae]|uniref:Uncharacterized protein n=1 Tax=Noviherbaspirillum cavernae TaxID=2320862 RepID=A0A418WXY7_9BURK|nr:hypothetical protein [Noviherbaspirillum cavernae]RJG05067.1 hypothetical protein D3870_02675 [Noviherbaspirillum cavernae]
MDSKKDAVKKLCDYISRTVVEAEPNGEFYHAPLKRLRARKTVSMPASVKIREVAVLDFPV